MSKNFPELLANVQLIAGALLFFLASWLLFGPTDLPGGRDHFVALELGLYSVIVLCCGVLLKKASRLWVPNQITFAFATIFVYVDLCTSYSGWYFDM